MHLTGLSHDGGTFTAANSRLGSCSPKLKQALAEILVLLDPRPLPDVGSGTEPCHLVWSRKRADSQPEYSCAAGGCTGAPGCSAHTKELREGRDVLFTSAPQATAPGIPTKRWGLHPTRSPPRGHCTPTGQAGCPPKPSNRAVHHISSWLSSNIIETNKKNRLLANI